MNPIRIVPDLRGERAFLRWWASNHKLLQQRNEVFLCRSHGSIVYQ